MSVAGPAALRSKAVPGNMDRSIQAYHNMNKFLAAYLEHVRISSEVLTLIYESPQLYTDVRNIEMLSLI
jgi:hypothetical protein